MRKKSVVYERENVLTNWKKYGIIEEIENEKKNRKWINEEKKNTDYKINLSKWLQRLQVWKKIPKKKKIFIDFRKICNFVYDFRILINDNFIN